MPLEVLQQYAGDVPDIRVFSTPDGAALRMSRKAQGVKPSATNQATLLVE
jgi:hypothetical protein